MKYQTLLLGILLTQGWMPNVAAKPITLYRIEGTTGSASNSERHTRQFTNDVKITSDSPSDEVIEDFSNELYDDAHVPNDRVLYQNEVAKLVQERREMFERNLVSMSVSLSFIVITPTDPVPSPSDPNITESGGGEEKSTYDILREKLLGEDAKDENDEENIDKANELASGNEGEVSGLMLTATVETETDYAVTTSEEEGGYVSLREKLLGRGDDEEFEETINEDIGKANGLAAKKNILGEGPKKNLRRR